MLKIAICAGNHPLSSTLKEHLARYQTEKEIELDAQVFAKGSTFLANEQKFDFVIMDVELQDESGIEAASKLFELNKNMPVVFITTAKKFAIKGYGANIVDFLTVPIGYYEFATMIDQVQIRLAKTDIQYIAVMTKKGVRRIAVDQIEYIEGSLGHTVYHMTDGDIRSLGSLNDEAKKLTADRFFRLGGTLLNLSQVNRVWESDVYVGKACLPLPRRQKTALLNSLVAFINRG